MDQKLSDLPELTTPALDDELYCVDVDAGMTKRLSVGHLVALATAAALADLARVLDAAADHPDDPAAARVIAAVRRLLTVPEIIRRDLRHARRADDR